MWETGNGMVGLEVCKEEAGRAQEMKYRTSRRIPRSGRWIPKMVVVVVVKMVVTTTR